MSAVIEVDFTRRGPKRSSIVFAYGYVNGPTVYVYDDRTLSLSVDGEILTADTFYALPEGDWALIQRPGFEVIGRLELSSRHLDLLVIDRATGQLYTTSILFSKIRGLTDISRQFARKQHHIAPLIRTK